MSRMLDRADETDAEVNWDDQYKINTFSRLNQRFQIRKRCLKEKLLEKECLEDAITELELLDENTSFLYKVGDSFILLPLDDTQNWLEKDLNQTDKNVSKLEEEISKLDLSMKELKKELYDKFGKAINLET
ncbi:hypothetical protein PCANB_000842 [Pneumocystis canis]|nr:hypothetical protein PCK1_000816 [Pneumocystis canis]KAG5437411.1 hypothetical protein PCANB_000842 [Pneumocystis canis]